MHNKKRVFLAIPFLDSVKEEEKENFLKIFRSLKKELSKKLSNIRWVKEGNLHLTLLFLGGLSLNEIESLNKEVEKLAKESKKFELALKEIKWGPSERRARMVWLSGGRSFEAESLKKSIESALLKEGIGFRIEKRPFLAHVTLARIKPELSRPFNIKREALFSLDVKRVELWESRLSRKGAEYYVLRSFELGGSL